MAKLNTINLNNTPQRILVYGPPKCGKSVACGMLAKAFQVIYIDIENAGAALINNVPTEYHGNIEYINLHDSFANPVAVNLLPKILEGKPVRFCSKHSKEVCMVCRGDKEASYELVDLSKAGIETVVVVDSFTQLTDSVMNFIAVSEKLNIDDKFQFDHWGETARRLSRMMSVLQVAPYHVVATSHEQIVTMPDKSEKLIPTLGSRNSSKSVGRYFDHLVRMSVRNKDFKSYSAQGSQVNAQVGTRSNLDMDADPTLTLIDLLLGKTGKKPSIATVATIQEADKVLGKQDRVLASK